MTQWLHLLSCLKSIQINMAIKYAFSLLILISLKSFCFAQTPDKVLYKQIDTTSLYIDIYYPENTNSDISQPAIVFFFGGGWNFGDINQFKPHATYFSKQGIVCFLVDYRVKNNQGTTPFESLKDAKSALRFIRSHAKEFHIDTGKIIASGGSAGGHLAAATAICSGFNESSDNLSVSCIPNALILFNPVIDNGPGGYGYNRIGDLYKDFSPIHNIKKGVPPSIFFLGTEDKLIPVETAEYYKIVVEKVGSRCDLELFEGEGHGFFNYKNIENYNKTITLTEQFLISLGYISTL